MVNLDSISDADEVPRGRRPHAIPAPLRAAVEDSAARGTAKQVQVAGLHDVATLRKLLAKRELRKKYAIRTGTVHGPHGMMFVFKADPLD